MIRQGNRILRSVSYLAEPQRASISSYLQGAVRTWCKSRPNEWFAARDFLGGVNFDWGNTPLQALYDWHRNSRRREAAIAAAGKDAGWLLKAVIASDQRNFDTRREYRARQYRWVR